VASSGDFELQLTLAEEPAIQPLIIAGPTAKADLLGIRTVDPGHFALAYESWGYGIWESVPIAMAQSRTGLLRVRFGPLLRVDERTPLSILRRSLIVWREGTPVWWYRNVRPLEPNPSLGMFDNSVGSSAMLPEFQGRIDSASRDPEPWAWRAGPFAAVEMEMAGRGSATEPLVATGRAGKGDTLSVRWLPGERAQLLYDHSGDPLRKSGVFDWPAARMVRLRAELPSLAALDSNGGAGAGQGRARIDLDGRSIWDEKVPFFPAPSASVAVGRNAAASEGTEDELTCVVADLSQSAR
jgi:hypothetical protein